MAELGIDFGVPALMLVLGVLFVWKGLRKWRRKGARRCFGCGYDMRGTEGLVCVECGYAAKSQRVVEHGKVRRGWLVMGVLMCLPGLWLAGFWMWYPWKAMAMRAAEARFENFIIQEGPVELHLDFQGPGGRLGRDPFAPIGGWDGFFIWLKRSGDESSSFCGMDTMYFSAEYMAPTLEEANSSIESALRRTAVYVAHQLVFPARHYGEYFPYQPIDTIVIAGTGSEVIPERFFEEAKAFDGIEEIALVQVKVDDGVIGWVAGHQGLRKVYILGLDASAKAMGRLEELKELEEVELDYRREITPEDIGVFSGLVSLRSLEISGEKGARGDFDAVLAGVVAANKLETLRFDYPLISEGGKSGRPWPVLKTPEAIGRCKSLKMLEVDVSGWSQAKMVPLGDLPSLKTLTLSCKGGRTLETLKGLAWLEMTPISRLTIKGVAGTDLSFLSEIWMLESLELSDVPLEVPMLRLLSRSRLQSLTLGGTGLSNDALNAFEFPRMLESLEIVGWVPSDEVCDRLAKLKEFHGLTAEDVSAEGLKLLAGAGRRCEVKLWASKLTKEEVEAAKKMNPDLKVEVGK